jgi:hypothetical protein
VPLKDLEARRAYTRRYYAANADAIKARASAWYEDHKDDQGFRARRNAGNQRWKVESREKYLAGRKRQRDRDRRDPEVVIKKREANRAMWERRRGVLLGIAAEAKKGGCIVCGEVVSKCLDFHHRDPGTKSFTIGKAMQRSVTPEALRAEIAKCDVMCANCHLEETAAQSSGWKRRAPSESQRDADRRREKELRWTPLLDRAKADGCTLCPERRAIALAFHHVDPTRKKFMVTAYRSRALRGAILEEMMKCVVLCANCHRRVHAGDLTLPMVRLDAYWRKRLLTPGRAACSGA